MNAITKKDRYLLLNITELQSRLERVTWFTALDLRDGYHLIWIAEGHEWKTAFRTQYGHYEYLVMPFGLTNAPAMFQRLINNVLRKHLDDFVIAYLDDILVYSTGSLEEHKDHVRTVLDLLGKAKLRLKLEKCEFYKKEVEFLGFKVTTTGIQVSESKIKAIKE